MSSMNLKRIVRCDRGATAVEYGLIVSLVVIACIVAFQGLAGETNALWDTVTIEVTAAMD